MAKFQNPGAFFLGTLVAQEQKFLKPLIENARKQGYTTRHQTSGRNSLNRRKRLSLMQSR